MGRRPASPLAAGVLDCLEQGALGGGECLAGVAGEFGQAKLRLAPRKPRAEFGHVDHSAGPVRVSLRCLESAILEFGGLCTGHRFP